jgi:hypothetical protein
MTAKKYTNAVAHIVIISIEFFKNTESEKEFVLRHKNRAVSAG